MADREAFAYAAGVFDDEGHIGTRIRTTNSAGRPRIQFRIGQRDPEMLERVQATLGMGNIYISQKLDRPYYTLAISTHERAQAAIAMMWPWLGQVKRRQASLALTAYREAY